MITVRLQYNRNRELKRRVSHYRVKRTYVLRVHCVGGELSSEVLT